jgi:hypothetical protein
MQGRARYRLIRIGLTLFSLAIALAGGVIRAPGGLKFGGLLLILVLAGLPFAAYLAGTRSLAGSVVCGVPFCAVVIGVQNYVVPRWNSSSTAPVPVLLSSRPWDSRRPHRSRRRGDILPRTDAPSQGEDRHA